MKPADGRLANTAAGSLTAFTMHYWNIIRLIRTGAFHPLSHLARRQLATIERQLAATDYAEEIEYQIGSEAIADHVERRRLRAIEARVQSLARLRRSVSRRAAFSHRSQASHWLAVVTAIRYLRQPAK